MVFHDADVCIKRLRNSSTCGRALRPTYRLSASSLLCLSHSEQRLVIFCTTSFRYSVQLRVFPIFITSIPPLWATQPLSQRVTDLPRRSGHQNFTLRSTEFKQCMGNLTSTDCISWHMAVVSDILAVRDKSRDKIVCGPH